MVALENGPAEVCAFRFRQCDDVDLLPGVLPDVSDVQLTRGAIEAEAPRVAQTEGPDFLTGLGHANKRIVGGNRIGCGVLDVEAKEFAQEVIRFLGTIGHLSVGPTVTDRHVKHAVNPELQCPTVVIREVVLRLFRDEQYLGGLSIGHAGIRFRSQVARQHGVAVSIDVEDVQTSIRHVGRMKKDAQKTAV
jgi:hypothetical protein